ncbi:MAG: AMP-binding protein [Clostridia bacterium]|nr:AMP-binding protein [Clostridia bacterium]
MKNILQYLEQTANTYPDKIAYADVNREVTFKEFVRECKSLASKILQKKIQKRAIAVYDNRDVNTLVGMFGAMYSGNFYVVIDSHSPADRIQKIYDTAEPAFEIIEEQNNDLCSQVSGGGERLYIEKELSNEIDENGLQMVRDKSIATDLAYILFTSGSTGTPKGTVVSHKSVIEYMQWYIHQFDIGEKTVFGSQTSFYFSASVSDTYSVIFCGATLHIIPRSYFSFPMQLVSFLNERKVNAIYWVPSALCIVANMKLFDYAKPQYLEKVLFVGEVMPNKQLNYWRKHFPDILYANLFGPTETVDICTFYVVNREFRDDEPLPIGVHCDNVDTFVVDENGKEVTEVGKIGELYVRSPFVAYGYYKNKEKTESAFVQNPLQKDYPEIVYKTGDLVKINQYGEYDYAGRTDFQIKHMGYRIELGEIETNASAIDGINTVVCLYDKEKDLIVLIYQGKAKEEAILDELRKKVPVYMVPNVVIKVSQMPFNQNGKIDRAYLNKNYREYIK